MIYLFPNLLKKGNKVVEKLCRKISHCTIFKGCDRAKSILVNGVPVFNNSSNFLKIPYQNVPISIMAKTENILYIQIVI